MDSVNFFLPEDLGFAPDLLEQCHNALLKRKVTLAVAESCTAGVLSALIVNQSGASEYYKGGVVSYWNEVKENLLGVSKQILFSNGAVSLECAKAMAVGLRRLLSVDYAVSVTGIAGPTGGSIEKPVGTVCIAVASNKDVYAEKFIFSGERMKIRYSSAYAALSLLQEEILNKY